MRSTSGDQGESAPQRQRPAEPGPPESTPSELAAEQGVPARGASHYAKGTAANMIRSMAVILAIAFALYLVSGRTNGDATDTVDVVGTAQHHAQQSGHPYSYPKDLPDDWVPTTVRYARTGAGVMTWTAGYTTPDGEYVALEQGLDADDQWIDLQTHEGEPTGRVSTEDGREWAKRGRDSQAQRSLVLPSQESAELTTVVTGTGTWEQLTTFAEHLVPADTGAKGASPA